MIPFIAFVLAIAALAKFTTGWTRGILITLLVVGGIVIAL